MSKKIIIRELSRANDTDSEKLEFKPGVNIIAGPPNAGKTRWLQMLDYLMGDTGKPDEAFSMELAEKYNSVSCLLDIEGEEIYIERRWKEKGKQGKIFINDGEIYAGDFSSFLLEKLEIPILHYPKGNPFAERAWPELSWRELLRHIYRQERFWTDIADRQIESVQHACIAQFLGLAKSLFSPQLGELINKQKELYMLQTRKEQFMEMLGQVSREMGEENEFSVSLTASSIDEAIERIKKTIEEAERRRGEIISSLEERIRPNLNGTSGDNVYTDLGKRLSIYTVQLNKNLQQLRIVEERANALEEYHKSVKNELNRLQRTKIAGIVLSDLKVTHCPVCDQHVLPTRGAPGHCYLCSQRYDMKGENLEKASGRIDFEISQLNEENAELEDLKKAVDADMYSIRNESALLRDEISKIQILLAPTRNALAVILPAEIGILDKETGMASERIRQLERLKNSLGTRDDLSRKIDEAAIVVDKLSAEVNKKEDNIGFEAAGDVMSDGMNTYLNALNRVSRKRWPYGDVRMQITERKFSFMIDRENWSRKLGATFKVYFLLAYHYSLLSLSRNDVLNGVGLSILDFPPQLVDKETLGELENFLIEPFVSLLLSADMSHTQLIVAGRAFENLQNAHRIELDEVWR